LQGYPSDKFDKYPFELAGEMHCENYVLPKNTTQSQESNLISKEKLS